MPFYLKELEIDPEVEKLKSALIVVCRFCPAASFAVREKRPYFKFLRNHVNTPVFEERIDGIKSGLEKSGLETELFRGNLMRSPFNFIICMWNERERKRFVKRAGQYEAILVMGCEAAYENVCDLLKDTDCRIFQGMETEGVFTILPKFNWPDRIMLDLISLTEMTPHNME